MTSKEKPTNPVRLLGRYEIVSELGRGAMGVVYKARDPKIDRFVAIKTISLQQSGLEEQRQFRERFFVEAKAAGRLLHPGIVAVFDVGEDPATNDPYIVMEYIEGKTLREMLSAKSQRLPLDRVLRITHELAEALDYAHGLGVVHRDIKPANILVTNEGQAKIGDFGIAQLDFSHLTLPGRVIGTPAYMSPEQLEGGQVDGRSDLFSLGAILYCALTGFNPFQGNSATTVCYKVANREPLKASALAAEVPPELDSIVERALAKNPADRYQRGTEFARELRALRRQRLRAAVPSGASWSSAQGARRTGPDGGAQAAVPPAIAAIAELKRLRAMQSGKGSRRSRGMLSTLSSERVLATAAVTLFGAAIVLGLIAWRQIRMPGPTRSTIAQNSKPASQVGTGAAAPVETTAQIQHEKVDLPKAPKSSEPSMKKPVSPVAPKKTRRVDSTSGTPAVPAANPPVPNGSIHAGNVAPATRVAPQSNQSAAQTALPEAEVADSRLEVHIENHFSDATLSIWIDGKLAFEHALRDGHRRLVLLGGAKETATVAVASGQHSIRVAVQSPKDDYYQSKTVAGQFLKDSAKILSINFEKHTKEIRVALGRQ